MQITHRPSRTLKDAINEAMRDWVTNVATTHYMLGTVAGPHPFPTMVRDFHKIIGEEAREQVLALTGKLPDAVLACIERFIDTIIASIPVNRISN